MLHHSITSSARTSTCAGTSRPSALAVLRLSTVSYLVGACTQIARLLALEDAVDVAAFERRSAQAHRRSGRRRHEETFDRGSLYRTQRDDRFAMQRRGRVVTIRPPFRARAKAATARSISPASRMLTGLTSTSDYRWMTTNWLVLEF
jgi:hypothetical protein